MIRRIICVILCLSAVPALAFGLSRGQSRAKGPIDLANRYILAYSALDYEALAEFYTDGSIWEDPTSVEIGVGNARATGSEGIVEHLRQACQGIEKIRFEIREQYHSGGFVISSGSFTLSLDARSFGKPSGTVDVTTKLVMVLKVQDGKILHHIDYTDFTGYREKITRALQADQGAGKK